MNQLQNSRRIICLFAILVACTSVAMGQTTKPNHKLLWKLTKQGSTDTSYVFGTMHVRHPDVFKFGDSLRPALLSCSVFANEVELTEILNWITSARHLTEDDEETSADETDDTADDYAKDSNTDYTESVVDTAKQAKRARQLNMLELMNAQSDRVEKFLHILRNVDSSKSLLYEHELDFYLWGYALFAGKTTIGLENIEDVMDVVMELGEVVEESLSQSQIKDPNDSIRRQRMKQYLDNVKLFRSYFAGDITMLSTCMKRLLDSSLYTKLITNRNHAMAHSIDSVAQTTSIFAAIGAAHLAGNDGVLELLRQKGWSLTPVRQTFNSPNYDLDWEAGFVMYDTILGLTTAPVAASFPRYPSLMRLEPADELDWEYVIAYDSTVESDIRFAAKVADGSREHDQPLEAYLANLADMYRFEGQREFVHLANGQTWLILPNQERGSRSIALSLFGDKVVFACVATYTGISDMILHRFIRGIVQQ